MVYAKRKDLGTPIDGAIEKSPHRALLEALRAMIEAAAPEAVSQIKWGMPNFSIDGKMMCALGAHKHHVNLILAGPPKIFVDPDHLLEGEATTGRHMKLRSIGDLPRAQIKKWLAAAAKHARKP